MWAELVDRQEVDEEVGLGNFIDVDDQLATEGEISLADLAELFQESDEEQEETREEEQLAVTFQEACAAMLLVRRFVEKNVADTATLRACDKLEEALQAQKRMRQTTLNDYFA